MGSEYGIFWGENLFVGGDKKEPIIEHFLYERDAMCLIADPGVGKSVLALQIIASLTTGAPLFGSYEVKKICNVLYVQTEGDRVETIERIRAMEWVCAFDHSKWAHLNLPGILLNTNEGFDKFKAYADQPQELWDVVIIDPLYTTVKGSMLRDDVATDWVRNLRQLRGEYGSAFIILHHDNKETRTSDGDLMPRNKSAVFGSVFWGAFFNQTFKLSVHKGFHKLDSGKQRSGKMVDIVELEMMQPSPLYYKMVTDPAIDAESIVYKQVRIWGPCPAHKIVSVTGLSRASVYRALRTLLNSEKVTKLDEKYWVKGMTDEEIRKEKGL
mgnify:CR=1 FL=1